MILKCRSLEELPEIAEKILSLQKKKIALSGELGSGKTTLIKELCKKLGYQFDVTSPTFTIINEYEGKVKIYHIDCYRLKKEEEIYELGLEEIFYSDDFVFIEWPEKIEHVLPDFFCWISISYGKNEVERIFKCDLSKFANFTP